MFKISNINLSQGPNLNLHHGPMFGNIKKKSQRKTIFGQQKKHDLFLEIVFH